MNKSQNLISNSSRSLVVASLVVLAVALLAPWASARIGETREQCEERYGKPDVVYDQRFFHIVWKVDTMVVDAYMVDGRCQKIEYHRPGHLPLTEQEAAVLVEKNCPHEEWTYKGGVDWASSNVRALFSRGRGHLIIVTSIWAAHEEAKDKEDRDAIEQAKRNQAKEAMKDL